MATDPVCGSEFLERKETLSLLHKRYSSFKQGYRQNMALVGSPGVGKSSALCQFLSEIKDETTIPIFFDIPQGSIELFIKRFMGSVLMSVLKINQKEIPWDVSQLIQMAKAFVPKTVVHMRGALKSVNQGHAEEGYKKVLEIPMILKSETGLQVVLVLDSFHYLDSLGLRNPFGAFGKQIMVDKDTMYLVASSLPVKARSIFREKLNLLFGNFEILEVNHFDFESARRIIDEKLNPFAVEPLLKNFLIQLTDAHPFYLITLLNRIREILMVQNKTEVTKDVLYQACVEEVLCSSGKIHQYFDSFYALEVKSKKFINPTQILVGIALGHRKISRLAKYVGVKLVDLKKGVQKLIDGEIIYKEGNLLLIPDAFLKFWLKQVVTIGFLGYETDIHRRKEYFLKQLDLYFEEFSQEATKDLSKRIEELFKGFQGEVINVGNERVVCPSFETVVSKPSNGRVFPVKAHSHKGAWICQIAPKIIKEDDIQTFLSDIKGQRVKIVKKILISLKEIDQNAVLIAKNARINIWDLKILNRLLDIYDRPKVIL